MNRANAIQGVNSLNSQDYGLNQLQNFHAVNLSGGKDNG